MQFKEQVWASFERELQKAVTRDSELGRKLEKASEILLENLNQTKVSNVVEENRILKNDQKEAGKVVDQILSDCKPLITADLQSMYPPLQPNFSPSSFFLDSPLPAKRGLALVSCCELRNKLE